MKWPDLDHKKMFTYTLSEREFLHALQKHKLRDELFERFNITELFNGAYANAILNPESINETIEQLKASRDFVTAINKNPRLLAALESAKLKSAFDRYYKATSDIILDLIDRQIWILPIDRQALAIV